MLQSRNLRECIPAVEHLDVLRLCRRQTPYGPGEMNKMRLVGHPARVHPALFRKSISLARVARRTRRGNV